MSAKRKTTATEAPSLAMRAAAARLMTEELARRAGAPEPQKPAACGLLPERQVVAGLTISTLSLRELRGVRDIAHTLSDVACALSCQPRCSRQESFGTTYSPPGEIAEWFSEVANWIMTRCEDEARERKPQDASEADDRLTIIAQHLLEGVGLVDLATEVLQALRVGASR